MTDIRFDATAEPLSTAVRWHKADDIALIFVDNPPVNASSVAVRQGLLAGIERAAEDDGIAGVVIVGAGKTFISGSDIKEFGKALPPPELPAINAAIEALPKPVLAAIHGAALGGGYELALACDWRVAAPDAVVGLPEVSLGMIPGAGGTQRLPRLVGLARGIDIITTARRVPAPEALALGMIDAVCAGDLIAEASAFLRGKGKRLTSQLQPPPEDQAAIDAAAAAASAKGKGRDCVEAAIAAVRMIGTVPVEEALAQERAVFQRLRTGPEATALRYNFFAERAAAKLDFTANSRPVRHCGVVGAGTMGAGIATVLGAAGFPVTLVDSNPTVLERAQATIATALGDLERLGKLGGASAIERQKLFNFASDYDALAQADLVIEAVFEDLAVKQDVLGQLGRVMAPGAILATNTSYLDIELLAQASGRPADFVGLHFFAPVPRMRLLEVVQCQATAPEVLATAFALAKSIGKLPVLARPTEGFIGNRIYAKYRGQCEYALEDGALPAAIDKVATGLGFAMGLFAVSDISGLDIAWRLRQSKAATRDPRERYVAIPDAVCALGRLGRKTEAGWYDYGADGKASPSPVVADLVAKAAAARGADAPDPATIADRIMGAIVNEAALILGEGAARSAEDIDVVLVNGYGFAKTRGGPLFQAAQLEPQRVAEMVDAAAAATGWGFRRGDVDALLAPLRR